MSSDINCIFLEGRYSLVLPRHREPRLEDLCRVSDRRGEQLLEVLVLLQLVVSRLPPLVNSLQGKKCISSDLQIVYGGG